MKELTEVEKAYMAGIVDGEGTLQIQTHKSKYCILGYNISPRISIPNTNKELIDWIKERFPEFTYWFRKGRKLQHKNTHVLVISKRKDILNFINLIYPFLIIKKRHAEIILEYCNMREDKLKEDYHYNLGKEEIRLYEEIKILNKKGPGESLFVE